MTIPTLSKSLFKLGLECPLRIKHSLFGALAKRCGLTHIRPQRRQSVGLMYSRS